MATKLMQDTYNELVFQVSKPYEPLFIGLVFELGIEAIQEDKGFIVVRSSENLDQVAWALELLKDKLLQNGNELEFSSQLHIKQNKDWIQEYQKSVKAVEIGDFYIHSSWQKEKKGCKNIIIDPALAFGSGHHESTSSCIELLQEFTKENDKLLDVGCGSGILSIVAAKLSCKVDACDTDEQAVSSARSNANLNKVSFERLWQGTISKSGDYDIVVANLVFDIILSLKKELVANVKKGRFLILSGIIARYEERVKDEFKDLQLIKFCQKNEWLSFVYQK